jgi:exodeoxyribonuclease VIII
METHETEAVALPTDVSDLTFKEYHAIEAWGSSALRAMRRGPPARVIWERDRPDWNTDATILGSAVHCALLTPDIYTRDFAVKPVGMTFASKEGKAWRDDPIRAGATMLSADAGSTVNAIVNALMDKTAVRESIEKASMREKSIVWDCSITGERCKARPDWIEGRYIYDLKVSRHASGSALGYRAFVEGWMHQLAHYRTGASAVGMDVRGGRLVVVEPSAPHFVYTLEVKIDALDLIEIENIATVKILRECRLNELWPGTPNDWIKIEPPASANMDAMNDVNLSEDNEEAEQAQEVV